MEMDLVVGDEDGRVALVEHTGTLRGGIPLFRQPVYFKQEADTLKFGALASPFAFDWDGDGDEDILCGNTAGEIGVFTNMDGNGTQWSAPEKLEVDGKPFRVMAGVSVRFKGPQKPSGDTTFSVSDWDGDGDRGLHRQLHSGSTSHARKPGRYAQPLPFWKSSPPSLLLVANPLQRTLRLSGAPLPLPVTLIKMIKWISSFWIRKGI